MSYEKVAVITGAANANGQAIAARLAEDGYALALCDEKKEELEKVKAALPNSVNCRIYALQQDSEEAVKALFGKLKGELGRVDVLVNNQIANSVKSFAETDAEDIRAAFDGGIIPAMLFTQCASELMIAGKIAGHIVNASTDYAFAASNDSFVESVTSWAMRGTTRAMAKHLAKKDIKVNAYCLGGVTPEEAANAVAYLVGPYNANITGQNVMVNNGRVMD